MKKLLTLILALGLLLSVASFASAEEKVTLTLTYAGSVEEFTPIQDAINTHAGDLEGIEINIIHIPAGEYWNKVTIHVRRQRRSRRAVYVRTLPAVC